uniref:Uncharacterized protein n=1 Tax=Leptocylindrus danicus TaxID=163516 RepID=A0A7S2LHM4_9STRA
MSNFESPIVNRSLNTEFPQMPPPPHPACPLFVTLNSNMLRKLQFPELSDESTSSPPKRLRPRFTLRTSLHTSTNLVMDVENQGGKPQKACPPSPHCAAFDKWGTRPCKKIKRGSFFKLERPNMKVLQTRNKRPLMTRCASELESKFKRRGSEVGPGKTLKPRTARRCSI